MTLAEACELLVTAYRPQGNRVEMFPGITDAAKFTQAWAVLRDYVETCRAGQSADHQTE